MPVGSIARDSVSAVSVTVFPDHFYTGFFESLLDSGAGDGDAQIREALDATRRSAFVIFEREVPAPRSGTRPGRLRES